MHPHQYWTVLRMATGSPPLPLKFIPPAYFQENHKSAMSHRSFVDEAIKGLLSNRCAMRVEERPYVCSPLSVVSKSMGNLHLVLNLWYLNQLLHVVSFRYEDLCIAALMFEANDFIQISVGWYWYLLWRLLYKNCTRLLRYYITYSRLDITV